MIRVSELRLLFVESPIGWVKTRKVKESVRLYDGHGWCEIRVQNMKIEASGSTRGPFELILYSLIVLMSTIKPENMNRIGVLVMELEMIHFFNHALRERSF